MRALLLFISQHHATCLLSCRINMMPFKLVTFDATGTLFFFRVPVLEKYVEMGLKCGITADSKILEKNVKEAWQTLNQEHPNFGSSTGLGWRNWWARFVEKTFTGYIEPEVKSKAAAIAKELIDFYTTKNGFAIRPGTEDLLKYLQTESVQLGVISNYDPRLHQILDFLGLKKYFGFVLTSYEFGYSKPNTKIFKEAVRLGKCPSTQEALHIGDDLELDYIGAKEAGLNAILVTEKKPKDMIEKNEVFEDFYKVKEHLQSLAKA